MQYCTASRYQFKFGELSLNCFTYFKIPKQGAQIAFEFYLSFQNLRGSLSPRLKSVFVCSLHVSKANRAPSPFFKSCERIPVYLSTKRRKGLEKFSKELSQQEKGTNQIMLSHVCKTQMNFKSYLSTMLKNFKIFKWNIKIRVNKMRTNIWRQYTNSGLFNNIAFRSFQSHVPVPLMHTHLHSLLGWVPPQST